MYDIYKVNKTNLIIKMLKYFIFTDSIHILVSGFEMPISPGFTHWVNPGKPGLGFKPYFGKSGEYWVNFFLNVQMFRIVQICGY